MLEAGLAFEGFVEAVVDEEDRRLAVVHLLEEVGVAFFLRAETGTGFAPDGVTAPAEIAEGEARVAEAEDEGGFEVAGRLIAFDEGAAEEDDAVAVGGFEFWGFGGAEEWGEGDCEEK